MSCCFFACCQKSSDSTVKPVTPNIADQDNHIACRKIFSAAIAVLGVLAIGSAVAIGILFNAATVFTIGTWACSGIALAVILGITGGVLGTTSIVTCSASVKVIEEKLN